MPATVVLGAQWGDEGKGKLVDRMVESAVWVHVSKGEIMLAILWL